MSLSSPIARLDGWRFRKYPTKKELLDEIGELLVIKAKLQSENDGLKSECQTVKDRLSIIQVLVEPEWSGTVELKEGQRE